MVIEIQDFEKYDLQSDFVFKRFWYYIHCPFFVFDILLLLT